MGVITHIQFGLRRVPEDDRETRDVLENALKYSRRCADIVKDLLAYSRDSVRQANAASDLRGNVYQSIEEALADTAGRCEDAKVDIHVSLPPGLPSVRLDNSGMRQVFVNLVANACDAMRGRETRQLRIGACRDGGTVVVTAEDSGYGMDEQALAHAFEPFFTTKAQSGTGLGLALCKRIVESIGGRIDVQSTTGVGTTFTLVLPICRPAAVEPADTPDEVYTEKS
jgi:two-component system, NtrC family, sensor kinase